MSASTAPILNWNLNSCPRLQPAKHRGLHPTDRQNIKLGHLSFVPLLGGLQQQRGTFETVNLSEA